MSNDKAAGVDGVANEVLKLRVFRHTLLQIIKGVFITKVVPMEWIMSILVPVFKKGDSSDINNYRGVALMSTFTKYIIDCCWKGCELFLIKT